MAHLTFIGIGKNPEGPDLPLGLGMHLAQDPKALDAFAKLTNDEKSRMISQIQGASTGDEAKQRIVEAVETLHNRQ